LLQIDELLLENRPQGGLRATLVLPRRAAMTDFSGISSPQRQM
jgi:hypothetical protein